MAALDELTAVYRDRGAAARAWKAGGGKVVAYKREITVGSSWTFAKGVDYIDANAGGPR